MDALPTIVNALVVAAATTVLWFVTRAQTRDVAHRIERFEGRVERLETRLDAKIDSKIDSVRADITQLAFRLGDRPQPQTG